MSHGIRSGVGTCLVWATVAAAAGNDAVAAPQTNGAFGAGAAWLMVAKGTRADVAWKLPDDVTTLPITGSIVRVWERLHGKTNLMGQVALTPDLRVAVINGPTHPHAYSCAVDGLNAAGVAWRAVTEWVQPATDITSRQLFPAIPLQAAPAGVLTVRQSDEMTVVNNRGWERFFVAGASTGCVGWKTRGLSLWVECEGREAKLCGASHDLPQTLAVPPSIIPDGTNRMRFSLRGDGKGREGLSAPLYLLMWAPTVTIEVMDE